MSEMTQPEAAAAVNQPAAGETAEISSAADENFQAGQSAGTESTEPFMTVKYNKKQTELSREEATDYAQKGMNYDKVLGRLKEAAEKLSKYESGDSLSTKEARQAAVNKQLDEFRERNPDVDPRSLPVEVLNAWRGGMPLSEAAAVYQANKYRSELSKLKKRIQQLKTNEQNAAASMGRPASLGATQQKPLTADAIKKMSRKEMDKNIDRIWEFLTGVKRKK